nr:unnamed protein product [Callosobruchus chinensis]
MVPSTIQIVLFLETSVSRFAYTELRQSSQIA